MIRVLVPSDATLNARIEAAACLLCLEDPNALLEALLSVGLVLRLGPTRQGWDALVADLELRLELERRASRYHMRLGAVDSPRG